MRVFFATGEASGDMLAATLAEAMRAFVPDAAFAGIGGERMLAAGFELTARTTGWASLGPIEALRRVFPLFFNMWRHALWLRARPFDLVVVVDFGAYNLRFAKTLRALGYRRPILYYFPPGAWLDRPKQSAAVARLTLPLTAFEHQRDFYRAQGLEIVYFGHPLCSLVAPRPSRPPAPPRGGVIALLPGSRRGEIERLLPPLLDACALVRAARPEARFIVSASDADARRQIERALAAAGTAMPIAAGARAAFDAADAAWIASGTAVLEATLREVPTVALYKVAPAQVEIAQRVWLRRHPFVTLPNILLGREIVPEVLQEDVTPQRLARALEAVLAEPAPYIAAMREVRVKLGAPDALNRCAAFAVALAKSA